VSGNTSILPLLPQSRLFIAVMPKNNNNTPKTNNKRGTYRRFNGTIKLMRRSEIRGYAIRYLDNVAENNGKCKHGFMAGLVREATSENNALQINSRDIENEVARIVAEQRKVQLSVNTQPLPLVPGGVIFNEAAVAVTEDYFTEDYFLYTDECIHVPSTVTRVLIHRSVESVYDRAFYFCTSLVEVVLHDGLRSIGVEAFMGCKSLIQIIIPPSVTSISKCAFSGCTGLVKVVLYDGFLQRIEENAFAICSSLSHIDIPPSVKEICDYAFNYCTALVEVVLHDGLKRIGQGVFEVCSPLLHIDIPRTVTSSTGRSTAVYYH